MHTPEFPQYYFLGAQVIELLKLIIPMTLFLLVTWYVSIYHKQMLNKLDRLISLLENKQDRE